MMLTELLATLRDLNVQLYLENDNLKCKAPPNTLTAELRSQLSERKQELISTLNQVQQPKAQISKAPRNENLPLSFAQQRLWFLDQLEPQNAFYNITMALRLTGNLNKPAVAQSLNEIVKRHESLRTAFISVDGLAIQKILPAEALKIREIQVSSNEDALAICQQEAEQGFDLSTGRLMRVLLIELQPNEHILIVTLHHIIMDGWSSAVLTREFATLYAAFSIGQSSPLPELALQYADFAYWQRHWLTGEVLAKQSNYWRKQLQDSPALLELPNDYARPSVMTHRGANYYFQIPSELMNEVNSLRQQQQTTLFMTLLSAFMVLLARYSQQTDICIGTPFANRQRAELEELIGFFVNTLVIRADLSAALTFEHLLQQVKQTVLDAKQHQDLPFEQLVELLQPERNRSYSPLFQVMFVLQNAAPQSLKLANLEVSPVEQENTAAKFDLTLHIYPTESICTGVFEYNTDLFAKASIERLAQHYLMLLQALVKTPNARWQQLSLLTAQEQQQILFDWNATQYDYEQPLFLHQLFEQQVAKMPNAVAVVFDQQYLTYKELNDQANQLACYLQQQGVQADELVGLCVERSLFMMIGMIGILKAGGAYLPLDPAYPQERLAYMLDDTQARFILTQQHLLTTVNSLTEQASIICLDSNSSNIASYDKQNLTPQLSPLNLAYVIYTSGSTGKPKGVLVSHANAVHSTTARFHSYSDTVKGYLLLSSFAFDSSIAGLFWTLAQGGCLCLPTEEQSKDPEQLAKLIQQHQLSHLLALPSLYALLLKQGAGRLNSLNIAIVAGESCNPEVVKQHYDLLPEVKLYNEYGPTENSVWSSVYLTCAEDETNNVSIGRPIGNVQIYLLDRALQAVPIGVIGEIYLGGNGVARGYLHQAALTAEKFIPNPFAEGQRLYKTGDLARYRAGGLIEFLGRIDSQVKIRGFRIELGEIEARLLELSSVQEAVVEVKNQQLIAYLVSSAEEADLKAYLAQVLPAYMLPSAFVFLERLPLTANGKLNRHALPLPNFTGNTAQRAPTNAVEQQLANIWQQLLQVEQLGIDDDFFALGGHSLLATQLLFAVRQAFPDNEQLTLKNFFAQPTIASQAKLLSGEQLDCFNLAEEVQLANDIMPLNHKLIDVADAEAVFLTGATGFLGTFLLADLLSQSRAVVYCLIRAKDESQALERLRTQLQRFELSERVDLQRVIAVCGDLAEPRLGLTEQRYQEIAQRVTVIYHNGALVNFIQPYAQLKPANVLGTQTVLQLACTDTPKAVHYVSTLSVFSDIPPTTGFAETAETKLTDSLDNGYSQSKWVAEKIMQLAIKRGFQVSIYRPATVAGDSVRGVWNSDDFLCRLLKGCIQLGYAPTDNQRVELAPVDYISCAIVRLSQQTDAIGRSFHLNSPHATYTQVVLDWFDNYGYTMQRVSYSAWTKQVLAQANKIENFALAPLLSLFGDVPEKTDTEQDITHYSCQQTQQVLLNLDIACPVLNDELLKRYLAYFLRSQFLSVIT